MKFISTHSALAIHQMLLKQHGGADGVRDMGLLESAMARPQNREFYSAKSSLHEIAAAYGYGIVRNHPFIDGNKRVGATLMGIFLMKNGKKLIATEKDLVLQILGIADSSITEADFARWIETHSTDRAQ